MGREILIVPIRRGLDPSIHLIRSKARFRSPLCSSGNLKALVKSLDNNGASNLYCGSVGGQIGHQGSDSSLQKLLDQYEVEREPIQIKFRELVDWMPYGERSSHMIHLYPAKLLPHIAAFFLASSELSSKGDKVLDPFSGSGTVLLEALLAGRSPIGADSNPLARLISKVKTRPLDKKKLKEAYFRLRKRILSESAYSEEPDVVNLRYWFNEDVIEKLSVIKSAIEAVRNDDYKDFFLVAFSNTVKRVSYADPRVSVPVKLSLRSAKEKTSNYEYIKNRLKKLDNIDVYEEYFKLVESNIKRIGTLECVRSRPVRIFNDARNLRLGRSRVLDSSVQLVITSPPYAGAQKYIRSSSLNLGWLGMCASDNLRSFEKLNIGREHYSKREYKELVKTGIDGADPLLEKIFKKNDLRAYIAAKYLIEMREAFNEIYRVLKPGGYFVLVTSSNEICGVNFETHKYLGDIAEGLGMTVKLRLIDDIHSRGLMTKRNKTAGIINCEWVYLFKK